MKIINEIIFVLKTAKALLFIFFVFSSYLGFSNISDTLWRWQFQYNYTKVSTNGFYGLVDNLQNQILPIKYDEIEFRDSVILCKLNGKRYGFDKFGKEIDISKYHYETLDGFAVYISELDRDLFTHLYKFSEGLMRIDESYAAIENRIAYLDKFFKVKFGYLKYSKGSDFHEGLAMVYYRGYWGFIDKDGNEVIPTQYEDCRDFKEGLAGVSIDTLYGFIDRQGKVVIPLIYESVGEFCNGHAKVKKDGKNFIINKSGEVDSTINAEKWNCRIVNKFECTKREYYFQEGLAQFKKDGKWGFIDRREIIIIEPKFETVMNFEAGQASVKFDGKWGVIDKTGKEIISPTFKSHDIFFRENYIRIVSDGKKFGIVNWDGKYVLPMEYDDIRSDYRVGNKIVCKKDGKKGLCDSDGKIIIPVIYEDLRLEGKHYIFGLLDNGKHVVVFNENGVYINEIKGDFISIGQEIIIIKKNEKMEYYHLKSNKFYPYNFNSILSFYKDTGIVSVGQPRIKEFQRHINFKGEFITPSGFIDVTFFSEGLAVVRINNKYGFINNRGDVVIPVKYDTANVFSEGLALVRLNGKYGFIDKSGKMIINNKYTNANSFSEGMAGVKIGNSWGFINPDGKMVIEARFDKIYNEFTGGRSVVVIDKQTITINRKGRKVER